jgi:hypothetical protein
MHVPGTEAYQSFERLQAEIRKSSLRTHALRAEHDRLAVALANAVKPKPPNTQVKLNADSITRDLKSVLDEWENKVAQSWERRAYRWFEESYSTIKLVFYYVLAPITTRRLQRTAVASRISAELAC